MRQTTQSLISQTEQHSATRKNGRKKLSKTQPATCGMTSLYMRATGCKTRSTANTYRFSSMVARTTVTGEITSPMARVISSWSTAISTTATLWLAKLKAMECTNTVMETVTREISWPTRNTVKASICSLMVATTTANTLLVSKKARESDHGRVVACMWETTWLASGKASVFSHSPMDVATRVTSWLARWKAKESVRILMVVDMKDNMRLETGKASGCSKSLMGAVTR